MSIKTHVSQKVLRFLLKRTGDPEVAQEVLQETWVAALKSYKSFRHKSSYFTWLCKISLNKLADYYRGQVNHRSKIIVPAIARFNQIVDPGLSLEEKLALDELRSRVNQCLNLLPPQYRRLLQLKYYEQLSSRQISVRLNLSGRALEGKLYRARKLLAKIYAQTGSSPHPSQARPPAEEAD